MRWRRRGTDGGDDIPALPHSTMRAADLFGEALAGITQRPGRSMMTAFGTVLGVAVLVCVLGLTSSAAAQIGSRFDPLTANEVSLADPGDGVAVASYTFRPDAEERVRSIAGVEQAGIGWPMTGVKGQVSLLPPPARTQADSKLPYMAASPGLLAEAGVTLASGALYNDWHERTDQPVAVLGPGAARQLSITRVSPGQTIWLDGRRFYLLGVLADTVRHAELLNAVIIPAGTARAQFGDPTGSGSFTMWAQVRSGAANVVASQLADAVNPDHADDYKVTKPPDVSSLKDQVNTDMEGLFLLLAAVSLVIGMVGIANTTFVSVIERTPEIGLRRALGARSRHILAQFLIEAVTLGTLGGLIGASLGVVIVVATCWAKQWTAVLDWRLAVLGPVAGLLVGGLAGLYPARRASRIEPVDALRQS
ncbi:ABC transporter permease [Acidipropionibacterium virtanenii]|uniref:Macrolide export ATP-binding/permease protein MacB n=1 Tax=Acidipropionibacterium virtanenii TaxID=2057246 RepID=A0A344UVI2_9ACTN|nr:ABC transporter permease [Acidipropionibacterium virtanenii]AXE39280.1 Macrolide export ATP-binding/permease protein MacB [Acidipropionibacterium virtanenii]